jgi:tRNA G37 N-methylase TrmD
MYRRASSLSKQYKSVNQWMIRNASSNRDELKKYLTTPPYTLPNRQKLIAPPMVYISGEEMTRYTMQLM